MADDKVSVDDEAKLDALRASCAWVGCYYGVVSDLIRKHGYKSCVEVGVCHGFHAEEMLDKTTVQYTGVDPYLAGYDPNDRAVSDITNCLGYMPQTSMNVLRNYVRNKLLKYGAERAKLLCVPSVTAADSFTAESVDIVFVDGDHRFEPVLADLKAWWPKVRSGGRLCGDDFPMADVSKAVKLFSQEIGVSFELLYKPNSTHPIFCFVKPMKASAKPNDDVKVVVQELQKLLIQPVPVLSLQDLKQNDTIAKSGMGSISESEITHLFWNKIKLPAEYFTKYEELPPCPIKSRNYKWADNDFPRNWCVLDFIGWIHKHNIKGAIKHLGYTSDTDPELEFLPCDQKTLISYPPYDLHTISNAFKETFDFFLFNQTLEHLYNPFEAVKQIFHIMKPGGYVFTSVPTINIPHSTPIHFNGFTPMGLAMLFKTANFDIIEIGQWGNYEYITKLWSTHSWPGYDSLQKGNKVTNEERNVCQCWILARKKPTTK